MRTPNTDCVQNVPDCTRSRTTVRITSVHPHVSRRATKVQPLGPVPSFIPSVAILPMSCCDVHADYPRFGHTIISWHSNADLVQAQVGQNVTFRLVVIRLSYVGKYGARPRAFLILSDAIFLLQKISKFVNTTPSVRIQTNP